MEFITALAPYITWLFTAICWWKVFTKANVAGWKAIIPFYSDYIRYKIAGKASMYWAYLIITIAKQIYSVFSIVVLMGNVIEFLGDGTFNASGIEMKMISWGLTILMFVFDIYLGSYLAQKFGKSKEFGFGLGVFPIIFVPILAFGDAKYQDKEWI